MNRATRSQHHPFLQVVTSAKDAVAKSVTGVVDLAQRGRRWSGELRRSMSQAMDIVLGKSEELVDHFLPMTEAELGTDQRGLGLAQGRTAQHSTEQGNLELKPMSNFSSSMHPRKSDTQLQRYMGLLHVTKQSQTGGPENCFIRLGDVSIHFM